MSKPFAVAETTLSRDHVYYSDAVNLARWSNLPTAVGAVAAHNNKRLAGGFNTLRNAAPNVEFGQASYHAEHNVARMVPVRLRTRATLYVARLSKLDDEMPSRPCTRCRKLLADMGLTEVVYLNNEGKLVKEYI